MYKLYHGNCVQVVHEFLPETIDLVITSPPYDALRLYQEEGAWSIAEIGTELYRVLVVGGVIVWIVADQTKNGNESGTSFKTALTFQKIGFNLHDTMIWNKGIFTFPPTNRYPNVFEYMFIFSKGHPRVFNGIRDRKNEHAGERVHGTNRLQDGTTRPKRNTGNRIGEFGLRYNVWNIAPEMALSKKWKHPAMFPEKLVEGHVLTWSNFGDTVFDPFMGSGTTGKVAVSLGRSFLGCDISGTYVEMARARIGAPEN